jgi:hypothetical protein
MFFTPKQQVLEVGVIVLVVCFAGCGRAALTATAATSSTAGGASKARQSDEHACGQLEGDKSSMHSVTASAQSNRVYKQPG